MTKILFVASGDHIVQTDPVLKQLPYEIEEYQLTPWSEKRLPAYLRAHGNRFAAVVFMGGAAYENARRNAGAAYMFIMPPDAVLKGLAAALEPAIHAYKNAPAHLDA